MTTLQKQLQKIGTADLHHVTEGSLKYKASFLFSRSEAADQDLETIYAIARNGILELGQLDSAFELFEKTLFSESMKSVDRVIRTSEENEKLDVSISAFLRRLSPYFLLKPAGKVLEWLIRRFRVHEFNVDALAACILPYHETKAFVKMVSLLKIGDDSLWAFLKPVKKSEVPLPRSRLVKAMHKSTGLLNTVCAIAVEADPPFPLLHSFFSAVVTDFIRHKVTEEKIRHLLPYIEKCLCNREQPDLQISAYMIVSQLASVIQFEESAIKLFTNRAILHCRKHLVHFCLLTVIHLAQTQSNFAGLSEKAYKKLTKFHSFEKTFLEIVDKYTSDKFIASLIPYLCERQNVQLLEELIARGLLSSHNTRLLCDLAIKSYLALALDASTTDEAKQSYIAHFQPLLSSLSQRHVDELDTILRAHLENCANESNDARSKALYDFTSLALKGTRHEVIEEASTTLYLCLVNPSASVRLLAVKRLADSLEDTEDSSSQSADVIESALADCLSEFNELLPYVVRDAPKALLDHVPAQTILSRLKKLLLHTRGSFDKEDTVDVLKFLLTDFHKRHPEEHQRVCQLFALFVFAAPDERIKKLLGAVAKTSFSKNRFLDTMVTHAKKAIKSTTVVATFLALEAENTNADNALFWMNMLKSDTVAERALSRLVLGHAASAVNGKQQYVFVSQLVEALMASLSMHEKHDLYTVGLLESIASDGGDIPATLLEKARKIHDVSHELSVQLAQLVLLNITRHIGRVSEEVHWFSSVDSDAAEAYKRSILTLFSTFVGGARLGIFEVMMTKLISRHFNENVLSFLMSVWCSHECTYLVKARALQIAATYIPQYAQVALADFQHVIPAIIPSLADVHPTVRVQALRCLSSIHAVYGKLELPMGPRVHETGSTTEKKHKSMAKHTIIASSVYYGPNITVADMNTNDAAHLVDYIWLRNHEVSQDEQAASALVKEYLNLCRESNDKTIRARANRTVDFVLHHIQAIPSADIKLALLKFLDGFDSPRKLHALEPLLEEELGRPEPAKNAPLTKYLIRCYLPCNAPDFKKANDKSLPLFLRMLSVEDLSQGKETASGWRSTVCQYAMRQITLEFFEQAPPKVQQSLFLTLVDIVTNGEHDDVQCAKSVLSNIPVIAKMLSDLLMSIVMALNGSPSVAEATRSSSKRVRVEAPLPPKPVDLYELITVLELIDSKPIPDEAILIRPLFDVLTALVNADLRETPVSLEYIHQLILCSLTRTMQSAKETNIHVDESSLRVDVVVQCIRMTDNPQTHNQALLLMAMIASVYPECVLHNIMPVFTFMGANVLRQDDNYSFQVIQQTLEKIIPSLVASGRESNDTPTALALHVKPVIKVFVDALVHIPKHRRLRLFEVLVQTLGEDTFLYAIVTLLLEKHTDMPRATQNEAESLLDFALMVSQRFSPQTQVQSVLLLLGELLAHPNDASEDAVMDKTLYNVNEHTVKQLRQFKRATLTFVGQLLGSREYLNKVMDESNSTSGFDEVMLSLYREAIELLLKIAAYFTDFGEHYVKSEVVNPQVASFWRLIVKEVYEVLKKVNALLPLPAFTNVVASLLERSDGAVRRKAMVIFNDKVTSLRGKPPTDTALLVNMVSDFTEVIKNESNDASNESAMINKQTALQCISSLAKLAGSNFPGPFADAIPTIIGTDALLVPNEQVKISSLVCLTVICQAIEKRVVPHLPKFMPLVVDILAKSVKAENANTMLQRSVLSAVEASVQAMPEFIAKYLPSILKSLLDRSMYEYNATHAEKASIHSMVTTILSSLATKVPSRHLLVCIFGYKMDATQGKESLLAFCSLISQTIRGIPREQIVHHYKQLFKFFLALFDIRRLFGSEFETDEVDALENAAITAFLDLVVKMNETLFKPLFIKIVDWGTSELASNGEAPSKDAAGRVYFFYKLMDALLDKLKSIVTPYYAYVIDDVITRLESYARDEQQPGREWNYIMMSLQKSFLYDNDNLWTAAKFEKILDPVVNQMMVTARGDSPDYLTRMTTYVAPCLGQMAVTVSNDTLWKPMNHKVFMKTREDDPEIRMAALKCVETFYERLGEEWLLFLAESISFLAELLEDDDARVEKLVHQVNAKIEIYLGESLDKFFN